jgi:hypothetical protein
MATNDDGTLTVPHDDGSTATPKTLRRALAAEATTDLEDELASYRCRGCAEKCINGVDEWPTRAVLCVRCCSYLLADLRLTGRTDDARMGADDRC